MRKQALRITVLLFVICMLCAGCGASREANSDEGSEEAAATEVAKEETVTGLIFEVPQGFAVDEEIPGLYLSEEYVEDYACIYYQEAIADERYSLLTEEKIEELMQEVYAETYGMDTVVEVLDFHRFNLDGYEAYYTESEYSVNDVPMQTIEYTVISGEQAFSVTYMQKQNAGWKAAYAQSAKNLQVRQ